MKKKAWQQVMPGSVLIPTKRISTSLNGAFAHCADSNVIRIFKFDSNPVNILPKSFKAIAF